MKKSISTKVLALFMAVLIAVMCAPFAFAADTIALTQSNVTIWPTANGSIYFGQQISDGITLSGGEVQYNGTVVPGKFEFADTSFRPTSSGNQMANLTFIPDDTAIYNGFNVPYAWKVLYQVLSTKPEFVDEVNEPLIASEVEPGAKLSTSILSGGKMYNPYYPEESVVQTKTWIWLDEIADTIVNKSGYYEATFAPGKGYEVVTKEVYVKVIGETPASIIETAPTVNITYEPDLTWGEVKLEGGKAVVDDEMATEIEGIFTVTEEWKNRNVHSNITEIDVTFTPNDETVALPNTFKCPVIVNKKPLSFKDAEGNTVVDGFIFEVEPNEKMNQVESLIKKHLVVPEGSVIRVEDYYGYAVNGKEYTLNIIHSSSNYTGNELKFTIKFKTTELNNIELKTVGDGQWKVDCGSYSLPGKFTVYATLNGKENEIGKVESNQTLNWKPVASGDYTFRVEYTPVEDDYFVVKEIKTYPFEYYPNRYFKATGIESTPYKMGATVPVKAPATDLTQPEKPYYGFIGWEVVSGNPNLSDEQLASAEFSFTMPDENVELKANYKFSHELYFKWIWQQITDFFNFISNAVKELFSI